MNKYYCNTCRLPRNVSANLEALQGAVPLVTAGWLQKCNCTAVKSLGNSIFSLKLQSTYMFSTTWGLCSHCSFTFWPLEVCNSTWIWFSRLQFHAASLDFVPLLTYINKTSDECFWVTTFIWFLCEMTINSWLKLFLIIDFIFCMLQSSLTF